MATGAAWHGLLYKMCKLKDLLILRGFGTI
jgi:hypothetical protein